MADILIIDDDTYICSLLQNYLEKQDYSVDVAYSARTAKKQISKHDYDLILCDFRLPDSDGMEILKLVKGKNIHSKVVIMTAYADLKTAVKLIKAGALDYVTKPVQPEEILQVLKKNITTRTADLSGNSFHDTFVKGTCRKINTIFQHIELVAPTDITVLLEGETGSGKEYIARAIHLKSKRKNKPFVPVDCGAIPKDLANSELFGHIKGSFTGAIQDKTGYFEQAKGGTLFLDEIGNLSVENQIKLLRALQEKVINKVGDSRTIPVDVRIIVATNTDLMDEVRKHNFREDLYHRVNEFKIIVPPLRERGNDILLFIQHFIKKSNNELNRHVSGMDDSFKKAVKKYPWPGNLRELLNVIRRCVLLTDNTYLTVYDLPQEIIHYSDQHLSSVADEDGNIGFFELKEATTEAEKEVIINALNEANYNKSKAAKLLKIDRKTLYNKLKLFDINT